MNITKPGFKVFHVVWGFRGAELHFFWPLSADFKKVKINKINTNIKFAFGYKFQNNER